MSACLLALALAAAQPVPAPRPVPPRTDLFGDPLPDGAVARFGAVRLRHAKLADFVLLPGGNTVLTAGEDKVLRTWELSTGRQVKAVAFGGTGPGHAVTLSPDGKILAVHSLGELSFWDTATGKKLASLTGPERSASFQKFSPDGGTLLVGTSDARVTVYDWRTERSRVVPLPARDFADFPGYFSPDGKRLIVGGGWGEPLCVFDATELREVYNLRCNSFASAVSPDGKRLAVVSHVGPRTDVLKLFDFADGKDAGQSIAVPGVAAHFLAFSPDGKLVACGNGDEGFLVDLAAGRVGHRLTGPQSGFAFTPDGAALVASSTASRLRVWDVATGRERLDFPAGFGGVLSPALAASPDGRWLASGEWPAREVCLWDTRDGRLVRRLPLKQDERQRVRDVMFSADGRTLAAGQTNGLVQWWDTATGADRRAVRLRTPSEDRWYSFDRIRASDDGRRIVTLKDAGGAAGETWFTVWDAATGKASATRSLPGRRLWDWAWAGSSVLVPDQNGLTVARVETGRTQFRIAAQPDPSPAAVSPDGRLVAARTTRRDTTVGVWEVATGEEVAVVKVGSEHHCAPGPGGRTLVTTDREFLRVFDLAGGSEIGRMALPLAGGDGAGLSFVSALVVPAGGRRAVTTLKDGTGLVWDLSAFPPPRLVASAGPEELARWWEELSGGTARRRAAAAWKLMDAPADAVVMFLRGRLKPAVAPDRATLRRLVADLDAPGFAAREEASKALARMGRAAVPPLEAALAETSSAEVKARLAAALVKLIDGPPPPESLRFDRAVGVLEYRGTAAARALLAELAAGAEGAPETVAAKAALRRLGE